MLTAYQASNWGLFALSALKCKIPTKNDPHTLKDDTYFTIFRMVHYLLIQVFSAYLVINNYLLEYFKIELT